MFSFTIASLALLPALALASPLAASSTSVYQTSTSVSCSATGASTIYKTTTIHASVVSSTASTVYITPSASTKTTTKTVTSTSVVPTSSDFVPVLDTTSTFPAKGASALTSQKATSTVTCTNYQTIHTTVLYYPSKVTTVTASRPTTTSTKTSVVTVPSYAACGANNLLSSDPATGAVIDDLYFTTNGGTMLTQQPATTPYDCCVKCITTPDCAYSYFNDNYSYYDGATDSIIYESQCVYVTYSTCNQSANQVTWIADGTNTNVTYTVSNGNCGFASKYVAPRCQQVRTGGYVCDVSCNGTQVPVPSPTTSLPACTATAA